MNKLLGALMTLAIALSASAAVADELTATAEPFVKGAAIYEEGFHTFASRAALPTRENFETVTLGPQHPSRGIGGSVPWITYQLKEPGRFTFELQRMDDTWLMLGIGK